MMPFQGMFAAHKVAFDSFIFWKSRMGITLARSPKARLGVTGSPAQEFLQIDHSGKIRPNGSPWRAAIRLAVPT